VRGLQPSTCCSRMRGRSRLPFGSIGCSIALTYTTLQALLLGEREQLKRSALTSQMQRLIARCVEVVSPFVADPPTTQRSGWSSFPPCRTTPSGGAAIGLSWDAMGPPAHCRRSPPARGSGQIVLGDRATEHPMDERVHALHVLQRVAELLEDPVDGRLDEGKRTPRGPTTGACHMPVGPATRSRCILAPAHMAWNFPSLRFGRMLPGGREERVRGAHRHGVPCGRLFVVSRPMARPA
jgi:hypothetical protein